MNRPARQIIIASLLAAFLLGPLAACGKKGKLEPVPGADPAQSDVKLPDYR